MWYTKNGIQNDGYLKATKRNFHINFVTLGYVVLTIGKL